MALLLNKNLLARIGHCAPSSVGLMKGINLAANMRKALAQNPNLLRTLMGLGLTLIFLLGYAVYGATVSTEYYIYKAESVESGVNTTFDSRYYNDNTDTTTWSWDATVNSFNLTWLNLSVESLEDGTLLYISNTVGFYSHPSLGNPDATEFSCAENCYFALEHRVNSTDGVAEITGLTNPDPAIRGSGTVYADSKDQAISKARNIIASNYTDAKFKITLVENGDRDIQPVLSFTQVNEQLSSIERFQVDAATEFMWALAAVIGCFSMVLVPSFTIYFAARAKERKLELKLELAKQNLESE